MKTLSSTPALSTFCTDGILRPHVARIDQLSTWSDIDVDKIINWCSSHNYTTSQRELPFPLLVALASDVRTSAHKAAQLKALVKQLETATQARNGLSIIVNDPSISLENRTTALADLLAGIAIRKPVTADQKKVASKLLNELELGAELVNEAAKIYCRNDQRPG